MRIDRNGFSYKLMSLLDLYPNDSCQYVINMLISSFLTFIVLPIFVAATIITLAVFILNAFNINVLMGAGMALELMFRLGLSEIVFAIIVLGVYCAGAIKDMFDDRDKTKEPSPMKQWLSNKRDKICTRVEYYEK